MSYQDLVRDVVVSRREEIAGDLDQARTAALRAHSDLRDWEQRIALLEGLLSLSDDQAAEALAPDSGTLHEVMLQVLRASPAGMMRAGDLAAEINARHLYRMRDGRPVEPQQIHARVGNYPHLFEKAGTFIKPRDTAN